MAPPAPEHGEPARPFLFRNGARMRRAVDRFRARRRQAGARDATRALLDDTRSYAVERLDWLRRRAGLEDRAAARLVRALRRGPVRRGVLLIGYVEAGLGLGQSLRGLITALSTTDVPIAVLPFGLGVETRIIGRFRPELYDRRRRYRVNVVEVATDQLPHVVATFGTGQFVASYNILRTYWELPRAPSDWEASLRSIDEIWAPTRFVADAFRPIFSGPITIVPPAIDVRGAAHRSRADFGLADARCLFLFSFDFYSHASRKNPLAVVEAFARAFAPDDGTVGLVIKTTGAPDRDAEVRNALAAAAANDARIVVINDVLSRGDMLALIGLCDCYVSLHRSEGFGLGMAEAMALGKPVIGTDFSGSTDFLDQETGFPIPCARRPVRADEYPFADGQEWAEADAAAAAAAMRRVATDEALRGSKGAAAKAFIDRRYGHGAIGAVAADRLRTLLARPRRRERPARS